MKLEIRVQPRSSKEEVKRLSEGSYKVYMHEPAIEGKANKKLIEILSRYFGVKKSEISIISGLKSKNKIVALSNPSPKS